MYICNQQIFPFFSVRNKKTVHALLLYGIKLKQFLIYIYIYIKSQFLLGFIRSIIFISNSSEASRIIDKVFCLFNFNFKPSKLKQL